MNGSSIIELVYIVLNQDENVTTVIAGFCEENVELDVIAAITTYITRAFCRMRGKDFARKLMSTNTHSLKQSRRPTLAAASNPTIYKAKRQKVDNELGSNEVEYLLFDAATGNSSTEEKGIIDDDNLLEN